MIIHQPLKFECPGSNFNFTDTQFCKSELVTFLFVPNFLISRPEDRNKRFTVVPYQIWTRLRGGRLEEARRLPEQLNQTPIIAFHISALSRIFRHPEEFPQGLSASTSTTLPNLPVVHPQLMRVFSDQIAFSFVGPIIFRIKSLHLNQIHVVLLASSQTPPSHTRMPFLHDTDSSLSPIMGGFHLCFIFHPNSCSLSQQKSISHSRPSEISISSSRARFEVVGCSLLLFRCTSIVRLHLHAPTVMHSALAKCRAGPQLYLPGFSWQVCTQGLVSGHHQQNTNSIWVVCKNYAPPSPVKHAHVQTHKKKV